MKRFVFKRTQDESGVSGTGVVVEGIEFTNGQVAITWVTVSQGVRSTTCYQNIEDAIKIHGHGGKTELVWIDEGTKYPKLLGTWNGEEKSEKS